MSSKIDWTDETWPVIAGCSPASEGCNNCYSCRLLATRLKHLPDYAGLAERADGYRWTGEVRLLPHRLDKPLRRRKPTWYFVADKGDLFHPRVPFEYIAAVYGVMAACPQHMFQILTKRPERMVEFYRWVEKREADGRKLFPYDTGEWRIWQMLSAATRRQGVNTPSHHGGPWPLPNVWAGTSVENQRRADERVPLLVQVPAAVRFVSIEPMLEAIDLRKTCGAARGCVGLPDGYRWLDYLDWVICGCESGPRARPFSEDWARSLRDQCQEFGTPFFLKQKRRYCDEPGCSRSELIKMPELDGVVWAQSPEVTR